MIAFHGEPKLKDAAVARLREHREADLLVRGTYWSPVGHGERHRVYQGCAVGCLVAEAVCRRGRNTLRFVGRLDYLAAYEEFFGIPSVLAQIEEGLFEGSYGPVPGITRVYAPPPELYVTWPERFLTAIPVGADLSGIADAWMAARIDRRDMPTSAELMDLLVGLLEAAPVPGDLVDREPADAALVTLAGLRPLVSA